MIFGKDTAVAETHNDPTIRKLDIGSVRYSPLPGGLVLGLIKAAGS
jgi:hypothetical protein